MFGKKILGLVLAGIFLMGLSGTSAEAAMRIDGNMRNSSIVRVGQDFELELEKCGSQIEIAQDVLGRGYIRQKSVVQAPNCGLKKVRYMAILPGRIEISEVLNGTKVGSIDLTFAPDPFRAEWGERQASPKGTLFPGKKFLLLVTGGIRTNEHGVISRYLVQADSPNVLIEHIDFAQDGLMQRLYVTAKTAGNYRLTIRDAERSIEVPFHAQAMSIRWDQQEVFVNESTYFEILNSDGYYAEVRNIRHTSLDGRTSNNPARFEFLGYRYRVTPLVAGMTNFELVDQFGQKLQAQVFGKPEPLKMTISPDVNSIKTGGMTVTLRLTGGILKPGTANYNLVSSNPMILNFAPTEKGVFVGKTGGVFGMTTVTVIDDFMGRVNLVIPVRSVLPGPNAPGK